MPQKPRPERFPGHVFPQIVPEPDDVGVGGPAPWADLSPAARSHLTLDAVEAGLARAKQLFTDSPAPTEPAELAIVADGPARPITLRSAVLVALFEEAGESHVILTRRALTLRNHQGEIALPGGRCDPGEDEVTTALREANEEIGLEPSLVRLIGWLNPIVTFASSSSIWPVVGVLERRPDFTIHPAEVDRVFTVALTDLVAEGAYHEERWRRDSPRPGADADGYFPMSFFRVPGDLIWGATARIISELLCCATGAPWTHDRGW